VMDWGPYDFSLLNDLLKPSSVEVAAAWTSKPQTQADPTDVVYDVEGHVGAMLKYNLTDSNSIWVHYERASCSHGEAYHHVEIEGIHGAVQWSPYFESDQIIYNRDNNGHVETKETTCANNSKFGVMDNPVYYFYQSVKGQPSQAVINEQAVFNFQCLQAIYNCAETGTPQKVQHAPKE
jgi:predicted dehydrogenase